LTVFAAFGDTYQLSEKKLRRRWPPMAADGEEGAKILHGGFAPRRDLTLA
jgi:hypothetical protein